MAAGTLWLGKSLGSSWLARCLSSLPAGEKRTGFWEGSLGQCQAPIGAHLACGILSVFPILSWLFFFYEVPGGLGTLVAQWTTYLSNMHVVLGFIFSAA